MKIARVFPRKTAQSPDDDLVFFGDPGLFPPDVDEVHVSVTFTYDLPEAKRLARAWRKVAPVKVGGPAFGKPSGEFTPGMYLKKGFTITSRGCPNKCWFCSVWRREPALIELPIHDGIVLQDDNILACSDGHIKNVFAMLRRQRVRVRLGGGIEAARLKDWHIDELTSIKIHGIYFAYDTPDDFDPLVVAARKMTAAGFNRHQLFCYCMVGSPKDSIDQAEKRLKQIIDLGMTPRAMLYRDKEGETEKTWRRFVRIYSRASLTSKLFT